MAITGCPGIGKSLFLFYILWRLSKFEKPPAVVLHREKDRGLIYVFQSNVCTVTNAYIEVVPVLNDKTTWYLTDTLSSPPAEDIRATTILVSSPACYI
jgi:hypothetical protein